MLKKIACISIVILIVGALSLPCFAFSVPTYDEDTTQLVYYLEGPDNLFYVKDQNSYFLYNPTDSVQQVRLVLTDYFYYRSRFYIITSYSWVDNQDVSIQYSSKFGDQNVYTFTDYFGGDVFSEYSAFIGTINPDGSENMDFDYRELFATISINPGVAASFQFGYNRIPPVGDEGPGYDIVALMDEDGLMEYTAALYDIAAGIIQPNGVVNRFDFWSLFHQIGNFTNLQGYNIGYDEGKLDGYNLYANGEGKLQYKNGYDSGFNAGYISGNDDGYLKGVSDTLSNIGSEEFEGVNTFREAYDLGVKHVQDMIHNNRDLTEYLPALFESIFNGIFTFTEKLSGSMTVFGLEVSEIIFTFLGVAIATSFFTFVVGKIG